MLVSDAMISRQAIIHASLQDLRKFCNQLTKSGLQSLLDSYVTSISLTPTTTLKSMFKDCQENKNNITIITNDPIISSIKQNLIPTYRAAIYHQKSKSQNPTNTSSINDLPSPLLATIHSFLSFKQSTTSKRANKHFLNSLSQYQTLANYHIDIDIHLARHIFENRKLFHQTISGFKSINIAVKYSSFRQLECKQEYMKQYIYEKWIELIVLRSAKHLKSLKVDVDHSYGGINWPSHRRSSILAKLLILTDDAGTDILGNLERLCWIRDTSYSMDELIDTLQTIKNNIWNLKYFEFGNDSIIMNDAMNIITSMDSLHELTFNLPRTNIWNLFFLNNKIRNKWNKLNKLKVISLFDYSNTINMNDDDDDEIATHRLEEIELEFMMNSNNNADIKITLDRIFSHYPNIHSFAYKYSIVNNWNNNGRFDIDWNGLLSRYKLQNLEVRIPEDDGDSFWNDMNALNNNEYTLKDLCAFSVDIVSKNREINLGQQLSAFSDQLNTFMASKQNKLKYLKAIIGGKNVHYDVRNGEYLKRKGLRLNIDEYETIQSRYYDPIDSILRICENWVEALNLDMLVIRGNTRDFNKNHKIYKDSSLHIARRLSQISTSSNKTFKSLNIKNMYLSKKAREFIIFWFGFGLMELFKYNDYYLSFIDYNDDDN